MGAGSMLRRAAADGDVEAVRAALGSGADVDEADPSSGRTALMEAAAAGHVPVVHELLATPAADATTRALDGETALSLAVSSGHAEVVSALVDDPRVPVNEWSLRGWTPLIAAAFEGDEAIVAALLTRDDLATDRADGQGRTALWWAVEAGNGEAAARLVMDPRVDVHAVPEGAPSLPELATERGLDELATELRRTAAARPGMGSIAPEERFRPDPPTDEGSRKIRENIRHFRRGRR